MYRKDTFAIDAVIGMVKSTNHRFRVVTIFQRLASNCTGDTVRSAAADATPGVRLQAASLGRR
jgi:hypothetical protein